MDNFQTKILFRVSDCRATWIRQSSRMPISTCTIRNRLDSPVVDSGASELEDALPEEYKGKHFIVEFNAGWTKSVSMTAMPPQLRTAKIMDNNRRTHYRFIGNARLLLFLREIEGLEQAG